MQTLPNSEKENDSDEHFSSASRWIWPSPGIPGAWWMFRKTFSTEGTNIGGAQLKITSALYHIAYINGTLICRGPGHSYNFSKIYDEIDVSAYLRPDNDNVLAVLAVEVDPRNPSYTHLY